MGVGLTYAAGDEFGDLTEISYGFDAGPGSIGLDYGDYDGEGTYYYSNIHTSPLLLA